MTLTSLAASVVLAALVLGGCGVAVDRRATAREAEAEAEYPPIGQIIEVEGTKIHAFVEGQGPDLILLHGASGNLRDFTFSLSHALARDFRVIAFDRPGLGWSDDLGAAGVSPMEQARVLQAAARQLGVRNPVVLGHSYGGSVAMAWALTDPETAGLVLVSGATMPWPGGLGSWYDITASRLGGATVVPLITAFAGEGRAQAAVEGIFAPDAVPAGYKDYVGAGLTLRRDSLRINARQVNGLKPYLQMMAPNYAKLTLPVEIIHGTADTIVPAKVHAIPLSKLLPDANLTLVEGAGHMIHQAHPDIVLAAVARVAARVAAGN